MCIIHTLFVFDTGDEITGKNSVKIDAAHDIEFFEEQKEEQSDVVFDVEEFPFGEN